MYLVFRCTSLLITRPNYILHSSLAEKRWENGQFPFHSFSSLSSFTLYISMKRINIRASCLSPFFTSMISGTSSAYKKGRTFKINAFATEKLCEDMLIFIFLRKWNYDNLAKHWTLNLQKNKVDANRTLGYQLIFKSLFKNRKYFFNDILNHAKTSENIFLCYQPLSFLINCSFIRGGRGRNGNENLWPFLK